MRGPPGWGVRGALVSALTQGYGLEFFYTAGFDLDSCSTKTESKKTKTESSSVGRPKQAQVRCIYPTLLQQLEIMLFSSYRLSGQQVFLVFMRYAYYSDSVTDYITFV